MDKVFECADQKRCNALSPFIHRVLVALGHPEAFVTDESTIGDFLPRYPIGPMTIRDTRFGPRRFQPVTTKRGDLVAVEEKLSLVISADDLVVDVALALARCGST